MKSLVPASEKSEGKMHMHTNDFENMSCHERGKLYVFSWLFCFLPQLETTCCRVSRGDWLGNPANFRGTFCCFVFDVETYHHVTMTLHSLFQSKMADGADG